MLAYMCKYVPSELLASMGTPMILVEPKVTNFTQADTLMHANMCSYIKAVLEEFDKKNYEGMIFTSCCDSARRLYDTLKVHYPEKFFYILDLPRKVNDFSIAIYADQLRELARSYAAFSGKTFSEEKLAELSEKEVQMQTVHKRALKALEEKRAESNIDVRSNAGAVTAGQSEAIMGRTKEPLKICLAGARPGSEIKHLIQSLGCELTLDLTCTGVERIYPVDRSDIMGSYAKLLLSQIPCMRMGHALDRDNIINEKKDQLDGIVYHTIKFCDIYAYEYTRLKETCDLPMVKLETEATTQGAGQILTRLEAFVESLQARKSKEEASQTSSQSNESSPDSEGRDPSCNEVCKACYEGDQPPIRLSMDDVRQDPSAAPSLSKESKAMYVMGIDSGSTSTNAVIMNEKKEIISFAVVRTGAKSGDSANRILEEILNKANLKREEIREIISTGYGRVSIPFADRNVTEISCHGKGAHFLNPKVRTILDIGGQDSKAIRLDETGAVIDFVMNDKCAAGTGRFLEMMARTLEISIDELGPISLESKEKIDISSMCSVFAESEVISLIAQNKEKADIAKGIHRAIAGKAISLMKRVGLEKDYMMTGGVAKNPGVVKVLEEQLQAPLYIYEEPEIVGAIGAALYGLE